MLIPEFAQRLYHAAKGTARPRITVLGAYPLGADSFALRFQTSMRQDPGDARPVSVAIAVDGTDLSGACIELNSSKIKRGGFPISQNAYSCTIGRDAQHVEVRLMQDGAPFAAQGIDRGRIEGLLADFAELTRNAGADPRYRVTAPRESSGQANTAFMTMIAAPAPSPARILGTLGSLAAQEGGRWSATIVTQAPGGEQGIRAIVDSLGDPRIQVMEGATHDFARAMNAAIGKAREADADYLLFIDQGDELVPWALRSLAQHAHGNGGPDSVYCDIDHIAESGACPTAPEFKPGFSRDLLYSRDYLTDCFALSRAAASRIGPLPVSHGAAWKYELALKAAETCDDMSHLPMPLCHKLAMKGELDEGEAAALATQKAAALTEHLGRRGISADVTPTRHDGVFRTVFLAPEDEPRVSIVIPNKDHVDYLAPCIDSITEKAGYSNYEVVVVENNSADPGTFDYYRQVQAENDRVRVVRFAGPFNYSRIVNFGAGASTGELLLLLNNDTKVITDGFLRILAGYFSRPEMGIVGPRLLYADGLVQHAGLFLLESGRLGFLNQNLSPALHRGYLDSLVCAADFPAVLGACQMVRRSTFDEVGGYCEDLAVTCNDLDFCWKVRALGLSVVYTPHVELYHKEFGSRSGDYATAEQREQSDRESSLLVSRWPRFYAEGDGFINPNLNRESIYFRLGSRSEGRPALRNG